MTGAYFGLGVKIVRQNLALVIQLQDKSLIPTVHLKRKLFAKL